MDVQPRPDPRSRGESTRARTLLAGLLVAATLACGDSAPSGSAAAAGGTAFTPPAVATGPEGWESYVDAPMVDAAAARALDPVPDSPEAAAVKFLASRVRGDSTWKEAMVAPPSKRAERALAEWSDWRLQRFQLRSRKASSEGRYWLKVFFEVAIEGKTDDGEDDFELVREGDGWRVSEPPS